MTANFISLFMLFTSCLDKALLIKSICHKRKKAPKGPFNFNNPTWVTSYPISGHVQRQQVQGNGSFLPYPEFPVERLQ